MAYSTGLGPLVGAWATATHSARGGPSLETHFLDFRKWTSDCLFLWIYKETVSTQATVPQGPEGLLRGSDLAQQAVLGGRKGSMWN